MFKQEKQKTIRILDKNKQPLTLQLLFKYHKKSKEDLGGFKDVISQKEFYHAWSQTHQDFQKHPERFERDTQVFQINTQSTLTKREFSTQTHRKELFIDDRKTIIKKPNKYFDTQLWMQQRIIAAKFIQKMIRGCLARKRINKIKQLKKEIDQELIKIKSDKLKRQEKLNEIQIQKRLNPKSSNDFNDLIQELQKWKKQEIQIIKDDQNMSSIQQKEALKIILFKEIELLQKIERMKQDVYQKNNVDKVHQFLKQLGEPKKWINYQKRYTEVKTPLTEISSQLYNMFKQLNITDIGVEQRLNVLLQLKEQLKQDQSDLAQEIRLLITREADMISRKRPLKTLKGLRTRISTLFQRYIENPKNNPELSNIKQKENIIN